MTWTRVANLADLAPDIGHRIVSGSHRVALFLVAGEVYAIGDECSHAEASLAEGEVFDLEVECPRHGSTFDLVTGRPLSLPATVAVPVYPAEVRDGDIYLNLEEL